MSLPSLIFLRSEMIVFLKAQSLSSFEEWVAYK